MGIIKEIENLPVNYGRANDSIDPDAYVRGYKDAISNVINTVEQSKLLAAAPMLYSALEDVAQALAWQVHGECRGYSEKLLSVNDALDAAKAALAAAK